MDKKLLAKLNAANKNWKKAKDRASDPAEQGGFEELEDGRYVARLTDAEIGESKSSGRLQVAWKYRIVEGDYKGKTKMAFDGLESEQNLVYLARTLSRYGYEIPDDITGIEKVLAAIVKEQPLVRVRLKTRGEFQNLYIDNVFDKADEDEVLADARAEADADEDAGDDDGEADGDEAGDVEEPSDDDEESSDDAEEESDDDAEEESAEDEEEGGDEEDEEEGGDEEDDSEVALEPGLKVIVPSNGKKVKAVVVEVLDKEEKVRVRTESGKVIRVKIDELEADDEDDADEDADIPAAPAKKPAAKAEPVKKAPAPAKKAVAKPDVKKKK